MTIIYEINPPKVIQDTILSHDQLSESVEKLKERAIKIGQVSDGIHLTDSVLGIPRVSPITAGFFIRNSNNKIGITASIRVRDRNLTSITQTICDAILLNLNGVLILKGDAPPLGPKDSGLVPSDVIKQFNDQGFGKRIDMYLSISNNPDFEKIHRKIEAQPRGFVTQVISSIDQVARIVDRLKPQGFKIIPCILLSSEKNKKSAQMLDLDWSGYNKDLVGFVKQVEGIAGNVLISSPNDFAGALDLLHRLK
ncbi:MAG TPA: 5,10-methenyltetrahydrofolate synthetase [Candidatus Nitrosotalea sp.]|nr:5,10-methenyltetrahydrofolate synthetase [Candidatus Nitrosotalea sp.]